MAMSSSLANRSDGTIAAQTTEANPLLMLPVEWRKAVSFFWMCNEHLLRSPTAICARLKLWIEDGLKLEDAQRAFRQLMTPESSARFQYAGQLIAELSAVIAVIINRNRENERQEKFKRESEEAARVAIKETCDLAKSFRGANS